MTNARKTFCLNQTLTSVNGTRHSAVAVIDGVLYARLKDASGGGAAYAWDLTGKSLSLNSTWDLIGLSAFAPLSEDASRSGNKLPDLDPEGMLTLTANNGFVYTIILDTVDPEAGTVCCQLKGSTTSALEVWNLDGTATWAGGKEEWNLPGLAALFPEEEETDTMGIPEGCVIFGFFDEGVDTGENLPALEALSDYFSVLMDGKLTGSEILAQVLTAYQHDEDAL
jgi:hypothetical protein